MCIVRLNRNANVMIIPHNYERTYAQLLRWLNSQFIHETSNGDLPSMSWEQEVINRQAIAIIIAKTMRRTKLNSFRISRNHSLKEDELSLLSDIMCMSLHKRTFELMKYVQKMILIRYATYVQIIANRI